MVVLSTLTVMVLVVPLALSGRRRHVERLVREVRAAARRRRLHMVRGRKAGLVERKATPSDHRLAEVMSGVAVRPATAP